MTALREDLPFDTGLENDARIPSLTHYRMLGNTGLRVSALAYGAGTFGDAWGEAWSSGKLQAQQIFSRYIEAGGNFFDTSDIYQAGQSEQWLGEFIKQGGNRDRLVVSTKGTQNQFAGDPNGGGNGRKHIIKAVEASLKRLGTDYIDLYFLHHWDGFTPLEEVLATFDLLIQQGKIRHYGLSNFPAWYVSRLHTLAQPSYRESVAAIQNQYSLVAREGEFEYLPMCQALNIGFTAWSTLANGLLSGKYRVDEQGHLLGKGRLTDTWTTDPSVAHLTSQKNLQVLAALVNIADETGFSPSQVALNWMLLHQGVTSSVIGARTLAQLDDNLQALSFDLTEQQLAALQQASAPVPISPYSYHTEQMQQLIHTGTHIERLARS